MTWVLTIIAALAAVWGFVTHKNKTSAEALVAEEDFKDKLLQELNKDLAANSVALTSEEAKREALAKEKQADASIKELVDFLNNSQPKQ